MPKGAKSLKEVALSVYTKSSNLSRVSLYERLDYSAYRNLLRKSDLHVYFSRPFIASWGLVEALSCGCCVIASDISMVREIVKDSAFLIDHTNIDSAISSIEPLLNSPDLRQKMSRLARQRALSFYDVKNKAPSLLAAISATLARSVKAS